MGRLKYLLDTNIFSELARPEPSARVLSKFQQHRIACASCAPVLHELRFGILRLPAGKRRDILTRFMDGLLEYGIETLPYDDKAAELHAGKRAGLEAKGVTLPYVDGQIASIASANDVALVTRNTADFKRFPGLRVENWFVS